MMELSNDSNSRTITFINPTDNFTSLIRCQSNARNTSLYKNVTVIKSKCMQFTHCARAHNKKVGHNF